MHTTPSLLRQNTNFSPKRVFASGFFPSSLEASTGNQCAFSAIFNLRPIRLTNPANPPHGYPDRTTTDL
jgi:hypothetical protein